MSSDRVIERVAELERRLAALEASSPGQTGAPTNADTFDPDRFWVLAGLKERIGTNSAVLFAGSVNLSSGRAYHWQQGTDATELLEQDCEHAAGALAALGHPLRLKLLQEILNGAGTTAAIAATDGIGTTGQLYHHLRELGAAGWLTSSRRGYYEVPGARVVPLLVAIAAART